MQIFMSQETKTYTVNLRDQISPLTTYHWVVDDAFFAQAEQDDIQRGTVDVWLESERTASGAYRLRFNLKGQVWVVCDRCAEALSLDLEGSDELCVKLGEEDADDGEVITIPEERGTLDLGWNLYEIIALQLPLRRVHPDGECPQEALEALQRLSADEASEDDVQSTDPRWDALKKMLNNK